MIYKILILLLAFSSADAIARETKTFLFDGDPISFTKALHNTIWISRKCVNEDMGLSCKAAQAVIRGHKKGIQLPADGESGCISLSGRVVHGIDRDMKTESKFCKFGDGSMVEISGAE
ncbi:MAG: hypothetical protein ACXWPM_03490 [Bdellovibrionota bacterium]